MNVDKHFNDYMIYRVKFKESGCTFYRSVIASIEDTATSLRDRLEAELISENVTIEDVCEEEYALELIVS